MYHHDKMALTCRSLLLSCSLTAAICSNSPSVSHGDEKTERVSMESAKFILNEHDRWTAATVLYDDRDSGAQMFYPTNWAGDRAGLTFDGGVTTTVRAGTSAARINFTPTPGAADNWASITWAYPDVKPEGNWGSIKGRDLIGATALSGWICGTGVVHLKIGGVNYPPDNDATLPFRDPYFVQTKVTLSKTWTPFVLRIPAGIKPVNVIGGFTIGFDSAATVYIDELSYNAAVPATTPRFIRSYIPDAGVEDDWIRNSSYLYDNALVSIAMLSRSDPVKPFADKSPHQRSCEQCAFLLLDSICWAQKHDRHFDDGRWRNGYAPGPLSDPKSNSARLPGIWNTKDNHFDEDRYLVSTDTGNVSWSCLALLTGCEVLHHRLANHKKPLTDLEQQRLEMYHECAEKGARWICDNTRAVDEFGGFSGGFDGWETTPQNPKPQVKLKWRSTEHNLDFWVVCQKLAMQSKDAETAREWKQQGDHARQMVLKMYEQDHFWTGTTNEPEHNKSAVPLDGQAWATMAMGHDRAFRETAHWDGTGVPACVTWIEDHCRIVADKHSGYRFSNQGTNCWPEGASQLAATYRYLGRHAAADKILHEVITHARIKPMPPPQVQPISGPVIGTGILAAYPENAQTGFNKVFFGDKEEPWEYKARQHLGATAWLLLANEKKAFNPFWIFGPPAVDEIDATK